MFLLLCFQHDSVLYIFLYTARRRAALENQKLSIKEFKKKIWKGILQHTLTSTSVALSFILLYSWISRISVTEAQKRGKNSNKFWPLHDSKLKSSVSEGMLKFSAHCRISTQSKHAQLCKHKQSPRVNWKLSFALEYLSSWPATIGKWEQCLTGLGEQCRAPSQSGSHQAALWIKLGSRPSRQKTKEWQSAALVLSLFLALMSCLLWHSNT